jgi:hypothetical protein
MKLNDKGKRRRSFSATPCSHLENGANGWQQTFQSISLKAMRHISTPPAACVQQRPLPIQAIGNSVLGVKRLFD